MSPETRKMWLAMPFGIAAGVLASLLCVWLLSQAVGFEFRPALVASLSGAIGATLFVLELRKQERSGDDSKPGR